MVLTRYFEGMNQAPQLMCSSYLSKSILESAYDYGRIWIKQHEDITIESLVTLASKVMARTGGEYNSLGGSFDASKGEILKLNVTAGAL